MDQSVFKSNFELLLKQQVDTVPRFEQTQTQFLPLLNDDSHKTDFDPHYIYHTAWAARRLRLGTAIEHVDFASSLYFVSIASAIVPIRFFDYRPAPLIFDGVQAGQANLTSLPFESNSLPSVSCMHVVEHIGLGRYGDPVDYDGDIKAMTELARVVTIGGSLLFVVPVGLSRIVYNAHRIYSYQQIRQSFGGIFSLENFALITDRGEFLPQAKEGETETQIYGCGCFHLVKQRTVTAPDAPFLQGW